jgi:hypothetical protein
MNGQHSPISMVRCPNPLCDRYNRPDARFCGRCGTRLVHSPAHVTTPADTRPHVGFVVFFVVFCFLILLAFASVAGGGWWLVVAIGGLGIAVTARGGHRRHRHGFNALRRGHRHAR